MDIVIVLVIILVVVLIWRGPKTLPKLGKAFGQGVKEARQEIDGIKSDSRPGDDETAASSAPPAPPAASTPPPPPPPAS
jgi:Sec-independent protein translocase protein TatA